LSRGSLPGPLRGPAFGSYAAEDVGWLLTDLSAVSLEAPAEEREEAIQSGGAHYAESLPIEYSPDPAYLELFDAALERTSRRLAVAVGAVTEQVLAAGGTPVLASLARAGTPVGVLMRRWAQHRHGVDLPHYAVSIVRGRGIDQVALRWLAEAHDPADVVFIDGWTGKGAITRELAAALALARADGLGFEDRLAVLADPAGAVAVYGTREDFLIASSCLNATVSGLVSRTVLKPGLIGPHDFHGAKFYAELREEDRSQRFIDRIAQEFGAVADDVEAELRRPRAGEPPWTGLAEVQRISEQYGIGDVNLVKPGVGEATRVLLRRVPWRLLVRDPADVEVAHLIHLAAQRGVPVEAVPQLTYRAVGLIHPRFTRGAVGEDGVAAVPAG
jgi:hypothetical protein